MKTISQPVLSLILLFALTAFAACAQDEVPPPTPGYQPLSAAQLDQLLGPIALYPDPLLSTILPSSTLPAEIVLADRYATGGGDPNQADQQPWDPSVQAMVHYPQVLSWMDNNLTWTTQVGQAFENQQQDVMDSVQRLRTEAYNLGNLQSTPQQQVIDDDGYIEILPVDPNDVYVPDYQAAQVYYDAPYGQPFITFSVGYPIGAWLCCDFDWRNHHLFFWNSHYPRPSDWWHESAGQRSAYFSRHPAPVWHPASRGGYSAGYPSQGGDRGWNNNQLRRTAPDINRPSPAPDVRYDNNQQRPEDNAFIGSQSASDTRADSNRGGQSMRTMPSSSHSGGAPAGGGGFHSSGGSSGGGESHSSGGGGGGGTRR